MVRRYLYAATIALALVVLAFSVIELHYELTQHISWWDSFEHALGGVSMGFFGLVVAEVFRIRKRRVLFVLAFVLFAGVSWEIMEYFSGLTYSPFMSYRMDTIKDLILDCLGGYVAIRIGHRMHIRYI